MISVIYYIFRNVKEAHFLSDILIYGMGVRGRQNLDKSIKYVLYVDCHNYN